MSGTLGNRREPRRAETTRRPSAGDHAQEMQAPPTALLIPAEVVPLPRGVPGGPSAENASPARENNIFRDAAGVAGTEL